MRLLDAITEFLRANVPDHLFSLYSEKMEVQVQASPEGGIVKHETFTKENGEERRYTLFEDTEGNQWKHYRIPYIDENDEPHYNTDKKLTWNFDEHLEGIALTGWNWVDGKTHYVVFDFDSIINHGAGLTDAELQNILDAVAQVPWVSIWRSTSGTGYHIKVAFKVPPSTKKRSEHCAVAHAVLNLLSEVTGLELVTSVDVWGKPHWVWHTKQLDAPRAFNIIKLGEPLEEVPYGWQEYVTDRTRKSRPNVPTWVPDDEVESFEGVRSVNPRVALDHGHRKLLDWLIKNHRQHWWDRENWLCVCHTADLRDAKETLNLKGIFETTATGSQGGADHNCFMHPMPVGAWAVRRFNTQTEAATWVEKNGFILCYLNREPEWSEAMAHVKAVRLSAKRHSLTADQLRKLAVLYQIDFEPPFEDRTYTISKSGRGEQPTVKVKKEDGDDVPEFWTEDARKWVRMFEAADPHQITAQYIGDTIRAVSKEDGFDYYVWNQGMLTWQAYPRVSLCDHFANMGVPEKEIKATIGALNLSPWQLVSLPFQPEYPGGRKWNRKRAKFAFKVTRAGGDYFPMYDKMLVHIGRDLNDPISRCEICQDMGIKNGRDWLFNWLAIAVQHPHKKTHYLYIWSPQQETGKTTFHESISQLFIDGHTDGAGAIRNMHNAELEGKVIATIEEVDLSKCNASYESVKKLTATDELLIHRKYCTPYTSPNNLRFIHCTNSLTYAPIKPGDLRCVVIRVDKLGSDVYMDREVIKRKLREESSDFLSALLHHKLPKPYKRFWLPLPETTDRTILLSLRRESTGSFLHEVLKHSPGEVLHFNDIQARYRDWCVDAGESVKGAGCLKAELAENFPYGTYKGRQNTVGNVAFEEPSNEPTHTIVSSDGGRLIRERL